MNRWLEQIVVVLTAIVGLAMLSVLVSKNAQTGNIITTAGTAFANAIGAAVSPVTGGNIVPLQR